MASLSLRTIVLFVALLAAVLVLVARAEQEERLGAASEEHVEHAEELEELLGNLAKKAPPKKPSPKKSPPMKPPPKKNAPTQGKPRKSVDQDGARIFTPRMTTDNNLPKGSKAPTTIADVDNTLGPKLPDVTLDDHVVRVPLPSPTSIKLEHLPQDTEAPSSPNLPVSDSNLPPQGGTTIPEERTTKVPVPPKPRPGSPCRVDGYQTGKCVEVAKAACAAPASSLLGRCEGSNDRRYACCASKVSKLPEKVNLEQQTIRPLPPPPKSRVKPPIQVVPPRLSLPPSTTPGSDFRPSEPIVIIAPPRQPPPPIDEGDETDDRIVTLPPDSLVDVDDDDQVGMNDLDDEMDLLPIDMDDEDDMDDLDDLIGDEDDEEDAEDLLPVDIDNEKDVDDGKDDLKDLIGDEDDKEEMKKTWEHMVSHQSQGGKDVDVNIRFNVNLHEDGTFDIERAE